VLFSDIFSIIMLSDTLFSRSEGNIPHNSTVLSKCQAFCMYKWFPNELLNKFKKLKIQLPVMKVSQDLLGLKLLFCFTIFLLGQSLFVPGKELFSFPLLSLRSKLWNY